MGDDKWLRCVRRQRDPHDPEAAFAALHEVAASARVIDVVGADQDLLGIHGMPAALPLRYEICSWEWGRAPTETASEHEDVYRVEERRLFDELPPRDEQGRRPGVKQLSFLRRPDGVSRDAFREMYAHHIEKLRADQPGIAAYVQNVVEAATPDAPELDGVSEIWFASLEDFRDRYWSGPGVAAREAEETGRFLDFSRTWSLIVRERVEV